MTMVVIRHGRRSDNLKVQGNLLGSAGQGEADRAANPRDAERRADCSDRSSTATKEARILAGLVQHNGKDYWRYRFTGRSRTRVGRLSAVKLLLDTHIFLWSLLAPAPSTDGRAGGV